MKIAIVGSRSLGTEEYRETVAALLERNIPANCTEIVSGGARGVDTIAEEYADRHHLKKTVFLPDYRTYGRKAPLLRDEQIVDAADFVLAVWDGKSRGTAYTVDYANTHQVPVKVIRV